MPDSVQTAPPRIAGTLIIPHPQTLQRPWFEVLDIWESSNQRISRISVRAGSPLLLFRWANVFDSMIQQAYRNYRQLYNPESPPLIIHTGGPAIGIDFTVTLTASSELQCHLLASALNSSIEVFPV